MKLLPGILIAVLAAGCSSGPATDDKSSEWISLFDGKTPAGWTNLPAANIEDGCINPNKSGNYVTFAKDKYADFTIACDFKLSKGCNSGIFVRTGDAKDPVQTGIEIQVYDSKAEKPSKHDCGAIYDLVAPSKNTLKPLGEWNHIEITCDKNKIKVALNGEAIAEMDLDQWPEAGKSLDGTKNKFTKSLKDFPREGLLGFQDHGKPAWFKNIKLKKLGA